MKSYAKYEQNLRNY